MAEGEVDEAGGRKAGKPGGVGVSRAMVRPLGFI